MRVTDEQLLAMTLEERSVVPDSQKTWPPHYYETFTFSLTLTPAAHPWYPESESLGTWSVTDGDGRRYGTVSDTTGSGRWVANGQNGELVTSRDQALVASTAFAAAVMLVAWVHVREGEV